MSVVLAQQGLTVILIDDAPADRKGDGRAYALSLSSCRLLEAIGLKNLLEEHGEEVLSVSITDGRAGEGAGPAVLTFDAGDVGSRLLGRVIEDCHLRTGLSALVQDNPGITHFSSTPVEQFSVSNHEATVATRSGQLLSARLVAGCDGRNGIVAQSMASPALLKDYEQSAVVCTVVHELPHNGAAHQFFMPPGPLAILPLPGCRSSIVLTESRHEADRLMAASADEFMLELRPRFGDFLGALRLEGDRLVWPLSLSLAEEIAAHRTVLAGDSAHGIHPLAGQGLNLGLRDAAALAETIADARRRGEDFGAASVLRRYQEWRRIDTASFAAATDFFNWIYSSDNTILRAVRGMGMLAVNATPQLRRALAREAAGVAGTPPALSTGGMPL